MTIPVAPHQGVGDDYVLWNNAHSATLADYGLVVIVTGRFGLMFETPIGQRVAAYGSRIPLYYGEAKVSTDGLYNVMPRTGPARTSTTRMAGRSTARARTCSGACRMPPASIT
ncbi:DUF6972 family protein [Sorangium sp. So ce295]|uniref:DUF6972 family protein n=1 Tax=Sorangium sp. So ce295 TaxID=3133295 RepID=UPI003F5E6C38